MLKFTFLNLNDTKNHFINKALIAAKSWIWFHHIPVSLLITPGTNQYQAWKLKIRWETKRCCRSLLTSWMERPSTPSLRLQRTSKRMKPWNMSIFGPAAVKVKVKWNMSIFFLEAGRARQRRFSLVESVRRRPPRRFESIFASLVRTPNHSL